MLNSCNKKDNICLKSIYSYPSNQLSTKRLQASMIRNHAKITYNNTRLKTIYNLMLAQDYVINRNLLFQYKYKLYTRYLRELIQGNITQETKQSLSNMLESLVSSLTPTEYIVVFELEPPPPKIIPDVIVDSTYTFYVIQRVMPNRSYFIFKNLTTDFLLEPLLFYTFDVSDPSNLNTKLSFSEENYSSVPYRGVEYVSIPGTEGAKVILSIYKDITALQLYVYNTIEPIPVLRYNWGYSIENIMIRLDNSEVQSVSNFLYLNARQYSNLSVYEYDGPKYSINDYLNPLVFLEFNQYRYTLTYGTYYLEIPKTYAATLLNKGYEKSVSFIGDSNKKITESIYGTQLATSTMSSQVGSFDFYYGRVQLTIHEPFDFSATFYSRSFGFMGGMNLIKFVETLDNVDNIITLPYTNTIKRGSLIRMNGDTELKRQYGLSMGIYRLNIESTTSVAFLNDGKEDLFDILPTTSMVMTGPFLAPDGRMYPFYSGRIQIVVKGWFDTISMCTQTGYSGGYKLLAYNGYSGPSNTFLYRSLQSRKGLSFQNALYLYDNKSIYFNDDHNTINPTYGLYNGVYTIFNIPYHCPITLLNKNKESLVVLKSLTNTTTFGTGPDGSVYTFYTGTLRITVNGNFGQMSLYTRFSGYMGGRGMFTYDPTFNNDLSYPDTRSIPVINPVVANTTFVDPLLTSVFANLRILMNGSVPLDAATPYSDLYTFPVLYNVVNFSTTIAFNSEAPIPNKKYLLKNGIYILDSSNYITLLNAGNDSIKMIGILSQKSLASDGRSYQYFRGNTIAIYVYGNFGLCSLEALGGPLGNYILCHEDTLLL